RVVILNATSAIVTYEIRYHVASPGGQELETARPAQATSGWAVRDGNWWCVYSESSYLEKDLSRSKVTSTDDRWKAAESDQDAKVIEPQAAFIDMAKNASPRTWRLSAEFERLNKPGQPEEPPIKDLHRFLGFKAHSREEAIPIFKH